MRFDVNPNTWYLPPSPSIDVRAGVTYSLHYLNVQLSSHSCFAHTQIQMQQLAVQYPGLLSICTARSHCSLYSFTLHSLIVTRGYAKTSQNI